MYKAIVQLKCYNLLDHKKMSLNHYQLNLLTKVLPLRLNT